jgi:hypothetical protein
MPHSRETLRGILERALSDDAYLAQLADDPLGTLQEASAGCTLESVKHWFGVPGISDREMVEMLYYRLKPRGCSGGVGPAGHTAVAGAR